MRGVVLQIKRRFVEQKYAELIEGMYEDRLGLGVHDVSPLTPSHGLVSPLGRNSSAFAAGGAGSEKETEPFLPKDTEA